MSNQAKVLKLFISLKGQKNRPSKESLTIDTKGVIDDKFYAKDKNRLILITSTQAYDIAKSNSIELKYGDLGENILIDGSIRDLKAGDVLNIGDAVLEVTQNCTLCNGLSVLNPMLPNILKDDRGIFAKALNSQSIIKIGDKIRK